MRFGFGVWVSGFEGYKGRVRGDLVPMMLGRGWEDALARRQINTHPFNIVCPACTRL